MRPIADLRHRLSIFSKPFPSMTNDAVFDALEATNDEATFLRFVQALLVERRESESMPQTADGFQGEWANQSISQFLGAAHAWALSSGFGTRQGPKSGTPWRLFADFLYAGRGYE